jgi:hypothetical protein
VQGYVAILMDLPSIAELRSLIAEHLTSLNLGPLMVYHDALDLSGTEATSSAQGTLASGIEGRESVHAACYLQKFKIGALQWRPPP